MPSNAELNDAARKRIREQVDDRGDYQPDKIVLLPKLEDLQALTERVAALERQSANDAVTVSDLKSEMRHLRPMGESKSLTQRVAWIESAYTAWTGVPVPDVMTDGRPEYKTRQFDPPSPEEFNTLPERVQRLEDKVCVLRGQMLLRAAKAADTPRRRLDSPSKVAVDWGDYEILMTDGKPEYSSKSDFALSQARAAHDILKLHQVSIDESARHIERLEMHTGLLPKWAGDCERPDGWNKYPDSVPTDPIDPLAFGLADYYLCAGLSEEGRPVLEICHWINWGGSNGWDNTQWIWNGEISHWRPLPAAPKE